MESRNPSIGRRFGNYQITAEIACGSFGCVYLAQHLFLPRLAAIKLLHSARLHSRETRDEFRQEAQLLEKLKHPHILPIYEFGINDGLPYLVTEYASRGSLRNLLREQPSQPLPLIEAISILSQIGKALSYAHRQGVIHHDLKPENILFSRGGAALLADFGIAIVRNTATLDLVAKVNGTPAYMAPEQFRRKASRRSDQYSLGCIAYELVTGRQPFAAPDAISMGWKHMQESPFPPRQLNPDLPQQIENAILKALNKRRIDRYPDIQAFIQALQIPPVAQMQVPVRNQIKFISRAAEQYVNEGEWLSTHGRLQEALAAYEQALHLDPYHADAYVGKGDVLSWLGHYEEALQSFEQAIHLVPRDANYHNNRGLALYSLGRYREALVAYNQALRLDPHQVGALRGRSLALRRLGRPG
jgi:serine/threonine protein kinase